MNLNQPITMEHVTELAEATNTAIMAAGTEASEAGDTLGDMLLAVHDHGLTDLTLLIQEYYKAVNEDNGDRVDVVILALHNKLFAMYSLIGIVFAASDPERVIEV